MHDLQDGAAAVIADSSTAESVREALHGLEVLTWKR